MARALNPVVPPAVVARLNADLSVDDGLTVLVVANRDGWPHIAMISRAEIVVIKETSLRLALWPQSSMSATLEAERRATLSLVVDGVAYALRAKIEPTGQIATKLGGNLNRFDAEIVAAQADEAPYATITSGVTFRLHNPEATLPRWREVRAALADS